MIRRYSTRAIKECPKPQYDTGCTHCMPDMSKFPAPAKPMPPMPFHQRHLVIHTGHSNWPSRTQDEKNTLVEALDPVRRDLASILITNSDLPCTAPKNHASATLYPDNIHYPAIPLDQAGEFASELQTKPWLPSIKSHSIKNPMILVCGHGNRDERCGIMAPLLLAELDKVLAKHGLLYSAESNPDGIRIGSCSHVGGHAFAGNLIYHDGRGSDPVWYSKVFPHHIQGIVEETVKKGAVISSLARR